MKLRSSMPSNFHSVKKHSFYLMAMWTFTDYEHDRLMLRMACHHISAQSVIHKISSRQKIVCLCSPANVTSYRFARADMFIIYSIRKYTFHRDKCSFRVTGKIGIELMSNEGQHNKMPWHSLMWRSTVFDMSLRIEPQIIKWHLRLLTCWRSNMKVCKMKFIWE